jgi:hypothetical protein
VSLRRALLVVPAAARDEANVLCSTFAVTPAQTPDFAVPLTSDGETITHYACCPDPGLELTAALPGLMAAVAGSDYTISDNFTAEAGLAWLAGKGLAIYGG